MTSATITAPRTTVTSDAISIDSLTVTFSSKRSTVTAAADVPVRQQGRVRLHRRPSVRQVDPAEGGGRLTNATSGDVRLRGSRSRGPRAREIGYVFQRASPC